VFVVVSSPKGGCGASVVSTALAALLSTAVIDRDRRLSTRLVDLGGDQPAILGVGTPPHGITNWLVDAAGQRLADLTAPVTDQLSIVPFGSGRLPPSDSAAWSVFASALTHDTSAHHTVIDAGLVTLPDSLYEHSDLHIVVVQPCYLALRRAVVDPRLKQVDGLVVVRPPHRVLNDRDVENVLGVSVLASVPVDHDVARRVDSGLLHSRLPEVLRLALEPLVVGPRHPSP